MPNKPAGSNARTDETGRARRPYRSALRAQRAAETEKRITAAASELFAEHGFAATTVSRIAEHAGVAQPTVYATFGSKGEIVRALMRTLEDDADAAGWRARIDAEPDPRHKIDLFARWSRTLYSTGRGLISATQDARGDPAVAELHEQGDRNRREWLTDLVSALDTAGQLHRDLDRADAVDQAWILTGFETYLRATGGCGWSDDTYERWLAHVLRGQLCNTPERNSSDA